MWGGRQPSGLGGPARSRRRHAALAAVAAAAVAVGAMWLPWFRSGSAGRNSFGFFRAAQVLGIEFVTPFRIAWFLLPVLLVVGIVLLLGGAHRSAVSVVIVLGLILAVSGGVSLLAFGTNSGSAAAAVAGCCTIVLGVVGFRPGRAVRDRAGFD